MGSKSLNRNNRSSHLQKKRKHSTSISSDSSVEEKIEKNTHIKRRPIKKRRRKISIDNGSSSKSDYDSNSEQLNSSKPKKMQTIDSIQKQMLPSNEELQYRKEKDEEFNKEEKLFKVFTCTKCNFNFQTLINTHQKVYVHPLMDVLMCKKCCSYYGDGDFSLDSDNEDKYCRWCGEGGTIFTCSKCICGFCSLCIRRHFGNDALKAVEKEDDWLCYFCNPKPLWRLRFICSLAQKLCKTKKEELENKHKEARNIKKRTSKKSTVNEESLEGSVIEKLTIKTSTTDTSEAEVENGNSSKQKKRKSYRNVSEILKSSEKNTKHHSSSSGSCSSDDEVIPIKKQKSKRLKTSTPNKNSKSEEDTSFQTKRFQIIEKLENILKLTEHQMSFGVHWSTKKLKQFSSNINQLRTESSLKKECRKIKWFISSLASYLVGFSNSIDMVEKNLLDDEIEVPKPTSENSAYTPILQFLSFITNQVKMFSDKDIKFQELMEAEVYEDNYVIGLKVKTPTKHQSSASNTNIDNVDSSSSMKKIENSAVRCGHADKKQVENQSCDSKSDSSDKGEFSQISEFLNAIIQQVNDNESSSQKESNEKEVNKKSIEENCNFVKVNKNEYSSAKEKNEKDNENLNKTFIDKESKSERVKENESSSQQKKNEKDNEDLNTNSSAGNDISIEKSPFNDEDIQAMITLLKS